MHRREHPEFRLYDWVVMLAAGLVLWKVQPVVLPLDCNKMPDVQFVSTTLTGAALMFSVIALARGLGIRVALGGLAFAIFSGFFALVSHICP